MGRNWLDIPTGKFENQEKIVEAPRRVQDWKDHWVRSKIETQNRFAVFPAGTLFKITGSGIVKYLRTPECPECGIQGRISFKCNRDDFERQFNFVEIPEGAEPG